MLPNLDDLLLLVVVDFRCPQHKPRLTHIQFKLFSLFLTFNLEPYACVLGCVMQLAHQLEFLDRNLQNISLLHFN